MSWLALLCFGIVALNILVGLVAAICVIAHSAVKHQWNPGQLLQRLALGFLALLLLGGMLLTPQTVTIAPVNTLAQPGLTSHGPVAETLAFRPLRATGLGLLVILLITFGTIMVSLVQWPTAQAKTISAERSRFSWKTAGASAAIFLLTLFMLFVGIMNYRTDHRRAAAAAHLAQIGHQLHAKETESIVPAGRIQTEYEHPTPSAAANPVSAMQLSNDALPQADRTIATSPIPDWLTTGKRQEGHGVESVVLASQQFATEVEARNHADEQLKSVWTTDLARISPQKFLDPRRAPVNIETARLSVKDSYVQSVQRDFGAFFAPMYRVWYRVELSPQTREEYLLADQVQRAWARTLLVFSGFVGLLLVPLGIVLVGSIKRAAGGWTGGLLSVLVWGSVLGLWVLGAWELNHAVVLW